MIDSCDVIVIGGGATGTSVLRDLSMRGIKAILLEKKLIASGTTSLNHRNLLSGMRYVVKDPVVAKECAEENKILSKTLPQFVSKIKGYFVGFKNQYTKEALEKARELGLEYREVDRRVAFKDIPFLNKEIELVIETEDKNIDITGACLFYCHSSERLGGKFFENTEIFEIKKEKNCFILITNKGKFKAKYIINATGPWVNKIAQLIGVILPVVYNQGTIIIQKSFSPRGIQFLCEPSDGNAYIVHGQHAWLGTTSTALDSIDQIKTEDWAEDYLKEKISSIIPKVKTTETIGKFSGIRPLIKEMDKKNGRELSRSFKIVEKPENFIHVIGGKLTISRLMAEEATNLICKREKINKKCKTREKSLSLSD